MNEYINMNEIKLIKKQKNKPRSIKTNTHAHTHTHIYIYINVYIQICTPARTKICVSAQEGNFCVWVHLREIEGLQTAPMAAPS